MSNRQSAYDRFISVFSPEGKLYQIEYALQALGTEALTNVAVRGKGCAVVVAQKKVPDKLLKKAAVTHLYSISKTIGMCVIGRVPDAIALMEQARQIAGEFWYKCGYDIQVSNLARILGDRAQIYTQHAGIRPMGAACILIGMEKQDDGTYLPKVHKVDPSGCNFGYKATACGQKEHEVMQVLEKNFKPDQDLDNTIMTAIHALQKTLNTHFKAPELEVAVVSEGKEQFTRVSDADVEEYLNRIATRD
eukprot:Sspe_Gene.15311::Locus_5330_Transcript_1_3_Confidence_0.400_Length_4464::g.15311::m.15311/K02730/PSMA6; 20S proteasome subunit alpha 1